MFHLLVWNKNIFWQYCFYKHTILTKQNHGFIMWLVKIHSEKLSFCRHSIDVTPPKAPQVDQPAMRTTNFRHLKIPSSHVSRWVKLLHGANDILVIQLFLCPWNWWKMVEKRLSYHELQSNVGCGKLRHFHPAVVFAFRSKVHSSDLKL